MALAGAVETHYKQLEQAWRVSDRSDVYDRLVVPNGNSAEPFHRWFHLKEAFSARLLGQVISDTSLTQRDSLRILDCFSGSGTTVVSASALAQDYSEGIHVEAIEHNPFLHLVSEAKAAACLADTVTAEKLSRASEQIIRSASHITDDLRLPGLSTFSREGYFEPADLRQLVSLRDAVASLEPGLIRNLALLAAAACVEPASRLRRDGRALRFSPNRNPRSPREEFQRRISMMVEDIKGAPFLNASSYVHRGDGRRPLDYTTSREFDLVIFSPPYPNNIDYTEVYKMEAWYLELFTDESSFRQHRLTTVRSHPSVKFAEEYEYMTDNHSVAVEELLAPLLAAIPSDRYATGRKQIVRGYADDMLQVLSQSRSLIHDEGKLAFIVGNSVHGNGESSFVIAADLIMSRLAELAGWRVDEIKIARKLLRRGVASPFLRESVVVLSPDLR
ncbi:MULTISPECIES: hypothetical protein [unclassified Streptomyces]|uniref:hypothetical protein n=1 Tax=unclassified Streptomyces TaxID=2593676 RepID=UPI0038148C08